MTSSSFPYLIRRSRGLSLALTAICSVLISFFPSTCHAFLGVPMPPWRGVRQVLAVGPWGKVIDKASHKASKLLLKTTNTSHVLFVDSTDGSTRLIHKKKLPPKPPGSARIVAVSDTHGKHRFLPIPDDMDVLVHCGDLLQRYGYAGDLGGALPALYDFRSWLRAIPAKHKVFIAGNHDRILEKLGEEKVREMFQKDDGNRIHYLRDSSVQLDGLTIYGSPWSPEGGTGNTAFQRGRAATEVSQLATSTSPSIDILMTHAACGSWEPILGSHGVQLWVHGHWHDAHGTSRVTHAGCVSVNVASNDRIYLPKNPPIVMDVRVRQESTMDG